MSCRVLHPLLPENALQGDIPTPVHPRYTPNISARNIIFFHPLIPTTKIDPESYTWHPLDGELAQKLDKRSYVSLSGDRARSSNGTTTTTGDTETAADAGINDEEVSLFDVHMPGVLTLDEMRTIDLDNWLLLVHGTFVHMNVGFFSPPFILFSTIHIHLTPVD